MACGKFHKASKADFRGTMRKFGTKVWGGLKKGWNYLTSGKAAEDVQKVQGYVEKGQDIYNKGMDFAHNMGWDTSKIDNYGQKAFNGINKGLNTAGNITSHLANI